jgi:hypothetical protein
MTQILDCGEHGKRPWKGHVVCDASGAVYHTSEPDGARHAPRTCTCGVQLMPRMAGDKSNWTARSICEECYKRECSKQAQA